MTHRSLFRRLGSLFKAQAVTDPTLSLNAEAVPAPPADVWTTRRVTGHYDIHARTVEVFLKDGSKVSGLVRGAVSRPRAVVGCTVDGHPYLNREGPKRGRRLEFDIHPYLSAPDITLPAGDDLFQLIDWHGCTHCVPVREIQRIAFDAPFVFETVTWSWDDLRRLDDPQDDKVEFTVIWDFKKAAPEYRVVERLPETG